MNSKVFRPPAGIILRFHLYFSSDMAERLITAEVVRLPGFRLEGPQLEDVWVHSDHLPVVAELDLDFGKNK